MFLKELVPVPLRPPQPSQRTEVDPVDCFRSEPTSLRLEQQCHASGVLFLACQETLVPA